MPDPFLDRVVQYPKRFNIQADGADGTDIVGTIDGKKVAFTVEPGVITTPGTSLNAEELNKRIVGDFEDKTFTALRTLLDTLNIDKDQNANMIINKILMRTRYNAAINSGFITNVNNWVAMVGSVAVWNSGKARQTVVGAAGATYQEIVGILGDEWFVKGTLTKLSGTGASFYVLPQGSTAGAILTLISATEFDAMAVGEIRNVYGIATLTNSGFRIVFGRVSVQTF